MAQSIPKSAPKFEVDESRLKALQSDPRVVRYERPAHINDWSFSPTLWVEPGTDLSDLMNQDFDDCDEEDSSFS